MNDSTQEHEYCLDANVLITAYNVLYPIGIFPSLWSEIAQKKSKLFFIKPIFQEIDPITNSTLSNDKKEENHPLRIWLEKHDFLVSEMDAEANHISLNLEKKYETKNVGKGASETDIKLISYTKHHNKTVITMETKQLNIPEKKSHYKVPLICHEEKVRCDTFVNFLKALKISI